LAEALKAVLRERVQEIEKLVKEAEETIKLAKMLGVDVTAEELDLKRMKAELDRWKEVLKEG